MGTAAQVGNIKRKIGARAGDRSRRTIVDAKVAQDRRDVNLDRALAKPESRRYLLVRLALNQQLENVPLARGQRATRRDIGRGSEFGQPDDRLRKSGRYFRQRRGYINPSVKDEAES